MRTSLLVLSTLLIVSHSANACNGTFHTSDGSVCTWFDVRPTVHDSALAVACSCKSELNQSQSYGCQYLGELYSCREFRDDPSCVFDMIVRQVEGTVMTMFGFPTANPFVYMYVCMLHAIRIVVPLHGNYVSNVQDYYFLFVVSVYAYQ